MFIDVITEEEATGAVADYYAGQRAGWGFLPNYAFAFAHRPDVAAGWNTLNAAIRTGMDRRRFELATIAAARAVRSTYCTAAHSKFLRDVCADEATLELIAQDPEGGTLRASRPRGLPVRREGSPRCGVHRAGRCGWVARGRPQ